MAEAGPDQHQVLQNPASDHLLPQSGADWRADVGKGRGDHGAREAREDQRTAEQASDYFLSNSVLLSITH